MFGLSIVSFYVKQKKKIWAVFSKSYIFIGILTGKFQNFRLTRHDITVMVDWALKINYLSTDRQKVSPNSISAVSNKLINVTLILFRILFCSKQIVS